MFSVPPRPPRLWRPNHVLIVFYCIPTMLCSSLLRPVVFLWTWSGGTGALAPVTPGHVSTTFTKIDKSWLNVVRTWSKCKISRFQVHTTSFLCPHCVLTTSTPGLHCALQVPTSSLIPRSWSRSLSSYYVFTTLLLRPTSSHHALITQALGSPISHSKFAKWKTIIVN